MSKLITSRGCIQPASCPTPDTDCTSSSKTCILYACIAESSSRGIYNRPGMLMMLTSLCQHLLIVGTKAGWEKDGMLSAIHANQTQCR